MDDNSNNYNVKNNKKNNKKNSNNNNNNKAYKKNVRRNSKTASSLNFVVTNGDHVVATRHRTCAEIPPSLYLSVGHEYLNSGKMIIGGSNDISGIGALLIASEPLSQQYANQWMLLFKRGQTKTGIRAMSSGKARMQHEQPSTYV